MNAVLAGESGEAQVGDDEPLRRNCPAAVLVAVARGGNIAGRHGGHDIDAGIELSGRLHDRKCGRHFGVEFQRCVERSRPDFLAVCLDILLDPVG